MSVRDTILKHMLRYRHPWDASDLLGEIPYGERPDMDYETNPKGWHEYFDTFEALVSDGLIRQRGVEGTAFGYELTERGKTAAERIAR